MSTSPARAHGERLARKVRRDGVAGTVRTVAHRAAEAAWLRETHVWLVMGLDEDRPRPSLPAGLQFRQLQAAEVTLVADLGVDVTGSRERLRRGHQLFATFDDGRLIAVMWAFVGEAPTIVHATGYISLPAGHANPEDTVVAPDQRGRGIAPGMYSRVFDELSRQGFSHVVGKIPVANTANRRACSKVGWHEFAVIDLRRLFGRRRVTVRPVHGADVGWLAAAVAA